MYPAKEKRFLAVNIITIISLFVLILAGGVVRSSGSGMGCPDWPKCFGQYIPPTDESQLPAGYQHSYIEGRVQKNQRFAKTLDVLGYGDIAERIRNDETILKPEEFNASKTWTEYINRLIGAITGIWLLACVALSATYLKLRKRIFYLSLFNLILVGFQAWLGSIVVSTNLLAWVVTLHMLIALAILAISIYTYAQARFLREKHLLKKQYAGYLQVVAIVALAITIIQITIGTEVREQIDAVASFMGYINRETWVEQVGLKFNYHRDLSLLVFISSVILFVGILKKYPEKGYEFKYASVVLFIVALQIITGITLAYFSLPPVTQAMHILLASLLFGAQFFVVLLMGRNRLYMSN